MDIICALNCIFEIKYCQKKSMKDFSKILIFSYSW